MIDTDKTKHTKGHESLLFKSTIWNDRYEGGCEADTNLTVSHDAPILLAEVKRLQKENKILAKYRDIAQKYDDALLADGDTDPRWSELYE